MSDSNSRKRPRDATPSLSGGGSSRPLSTFKPLRPSSPSGAPSSASAGALAAAHFAPPPLVVPQPTLGRTSSAGLAPSWTPSSSSSGGVRFSARPPVFGSSSVSAFRPTPRRPASSASSSSSSSAHLPASSALSSLLSSAAPPTPGGMGGASAWSSFAGASSSSSSSATRFTDLPSAPGSPRISPLAPIPGRQLTSAAALLPAMDPAATGAGARTRKPKVKGALPERASARSTTSQKALELAARLKASANQPAGSHVTASGRALAPVDGASTADANTGRLALARPASPTTDSVLIVFGGRTSPGGHLEGMPLSGPRIDRGSWSSALKTVSQRSSARLAAVPGQQGARIRAAFIIRKSRITGSRPPAASPMRSVRCRLPPAAISRTWPPRKAMRNWPSCFRTILCARSTWRGCAARAKAPARWTRASAICSAAARPASRMRRCCATPRMASATCPIRTRCARSRHVLRKPCRLWPAAALPQAVHHPLRRGEFPPRQHRRP
jgi:hypothetical protein